MKSKIIDDNQIFHNALLTDIRNAQTSVYIELYRITDDTIGREIAELLIEKIKTGVKVILLLDAYGSYGFYNLANVIMDEGGEVKWFKRIKFFIRGFFEKNQSRNHRKLMIIDNHISYLGSSNITDYSVGWCELNLRIEDEGFALTMQDVFLRSCTQHKIYNTNNYKRIPLVKYKHFFIIQDAPSATIQQVKVHLLHLINKAKKEIYIETPYLLPVKSLRKALNNARRRGVSVKIMIPKTSDVKTADLLRNHYLGKLHRRGIEILLFAENNIHAKAVLIDEKIFSIGSSNIDFRSFRYQFEIMLTGLDANIVDMIKAHIKKNIHCSEKFDYFTWQNRGWITKLLETVLMPLRIFF